MRDPRFRRIVAQRSAVVGGRRFAATNTLLGVYPGVDGVKTGHTDDAGWNLVASAAQDGHRLFAAALGAPDEARRDVAVRRLLDWGFSRYRRVRLVARGGSYGAVPVPWERSTVGAVAARSSDRVLRLDTPTSERVVLPTAVTGAVGRGAPLGRVEVLVAGRVVDRVPLVAARAVEAATVLDRARWLVRRAGDTVLHPSRWW
jgi:D-alanyl-D-alanine carboxypeptidase (penicillin-binding protein 5/6)